MKKKWISTALVVCMTAIMALAGCGKSSDDTDAADGEGSKEKGEGKYTIGYTVNDFNDKWVSYVIDNIKVWDEENKDVNVVLGNGEQDAATQMAIVEDWIQQKFDVICVKAVDVDAAASMAKKCNEAGIPFVAVQDPIENSDVNVQQDSKTCGQTQMEAAIEAMGGSGKVAYMSGVPGTLVSNNREEGSMAALEKYPDVELVANEVGNWLREEAMTVVETWVQAGMEFDAIVCACDEMAIGAEIALESAGAREGVVIAGIDGTVDALEMMLDGKLDVTMYADPEALAREPLETAVKIINGEKVDDYMIQDILILPEDAQEYLDMQK